MNLSVCLSVCLSLLVFLTFNTFNVDSFLCFISQPSLGHRLSQIYRLISVRRPQPDVCPRLSFSSSRLQSPRRSIGACQNLSVAKCLVSNERFTQTFSHLSPNFYELKYANFASIFRPTSFRNGRTHLKSKINLGSSCDWPMSARNLFT